MFNKIESLYFRYWEKGKIRNWTFRVLCITLTVCVCKVATSFHPTVWYDSAAKWGAVVTGLLISLGLAWRFERVDPLQTGDSPPDTSVPTVKKEPSLLDQILLERQRYVISSKKIARDAAALGPPSRN